MTTEEKREAAELRRRIDRSLRELRRHVETELGDIMSDLIRLEAIEGEEQAK